jgi:hypothetical protein
MASDSIQRDSEGLPGPYPAAPGAAQSVEEDCRTVLARIDADWEVYRKRFMMRDTFGRSHHVVGIGVGPCLAMIVVGCVICAWSIPTWLWRVPQASPAADPLQATIIGLLLAVVGVGGIVYFLRKSDQFEAAEKAYQRRRALALERLQQAVSHRAIPSHVEPAEGVTPSRTNEDEERPDFKAI